MALFSFYYYQSVNLKLKHQIDFGFLRDPKDKKAWDLRTYDNEKDKKKEEVEEEKEKGAKT